MIYYVFIRDSSTNLLVRLTYQRWSPGRDPWRFQGCALAGVSENEWDITKSAGVVNMFANFSGRTEQPLFRLEGFSTDTRSPAIGNTGSGWYSGPAGLLAGNVQWEINDIT